MTDEPEMSPEIQQLYVSRKTKDLRQFGYNDLTEEHVKDQLEKVLSNESELTIIGKFIQDDINKMRSVRND